MYVIDQLGAALAEANRRIVELEEEIARLRAEQSVTVGDSKQDGAGRT